MAQNSDSAYKGKTVVAVRFSALGDVAMTLPVLYSAARKNPEIKFVFITRRQFASFAVNPPENLEVIGIDLKQEYKGVAGMMRLARRIMREWHPILLLDLHDVLRTKMLRTFLRMAGVRSSVIDKGRDEKKAIISHAVPLRQLTPMHDRYRRVLLDAGINPGDSFVSLYAGKPASPELFASATSPKKESEKWIGIAPFAKHKGKIYPPEKMEKVIETLSGNPDARIFLFGGGPSEQPKLDAWAEKFPRTVSLAGKKLGFTGELALMSYLDVMISMDSGNMHLASLAGVPVVSVWGATHPCVGFLGFNQNAGSIVQSDLPCRPCSVFGDKPCRFGDYRCFEAITPDEIVGKISSIHPR